MAEAALYGFKDDPQFPFDEVADKLKWIPNYIESLTSHRSRSFLQYSIFEVLINILLVFARARTSTLIGFITLEPLYTLIPPFVNKLNAILKNLPSGRGKPHQLKIRKRMIGSWFITTKNSPRFIWKRQLTHREIGLNLDLFAAGHILYTLDHNLSRARSCFVEIGSYVHLDIIVENVFIEYLPDSDVASLREFSLRKEALLNTTMKRLSLPYRFKWFYRTPTTELEVARVLQQRNPPTKAWWEEKYYFVNFPNKYDAQWHGIGFCTMNSRIEEYWDIIQELHNWTVAHTTDNRELNEEYWTKVQGLFFAICASLESDNGRLTIRNLMTQLTEYGNPPKAEQSKLSAQRRWLKRYKSKFQHRWHFAVRAIEEYFRKDNQFTNTCF